MNFGYVNGIKIIESLLMVEDGEPYEQKRTLKERLFTIPWQPLMGTRTITPKVPCKHAIANTSGELVMHPELAKALANLLK